MEYRYYIVKTHFPSGGGSNAKYRVMPLSGQGIEPDMKVRCSRAMRDNYELGTLFKIKAKVTDKGV